MEYLYQKMKKLSHLSDIWELRLVGVTYMGPVLMICFETNCVQEHRANAHMKN